MPRPNLGTTGWLHILPTQASRVYMILWFLHYETGSPPAGDLDDPEAPAWVDIVAPDGLEEPYDPMVEEAEPDERDEREEELKRWEEWQGYARARGHPMTTYRHVIEFMLELGLIERRDDGGRVSWMIVSPLPEVDQVLALPPARQEEVSLMRWNQRFGEVAQTITDWIAQRRVPGAKSLEIGLSIQALAEQLSLDPEDVRHGLAILIDEDIRCDVDPETAAIDAPLRITVDWQLFEDWRTLYQVAPREEDLGDERPRLDSNQRPSD